MVVGAVASTVLYLCFRKSIRVGLVVSVVLFVCIVALSLGSTGSWNWANRSTAMIFLNALGQATYPVFVLAVPAAVAARLKNAVASWTLLVASVAFLVWSWPLVSLYIVCTSGVDCV